MGEKKKKKLFFNKPSLLVLRYFSSVRIEGSAKLEGTHKF